MLTVQTKTRTRSTNERTPESPLYMRVTCESAGALYAEMSGRKPADCTADFVAGTLVAGDLLALFIERAEPAKK